MFNGIEVSTNGGEVLSMRSLVMKEEIEKQQGCQHPREYFELDRVGEAAKHVRYEIGYARQGAL